VLRNPFIKRLYPYFLRTHYQTAIDLRYSAHMPTKTCKAIKTESIKHKHNITYYALL